MVDLSSLGIFELRLGKHWLEMLKGFPDDVLSLFQPYDFMILGVGLKQRALRSTGALFWQLNA